MNMLLSQLLNRGDIIEVCGGRLIITPSSGLSVPNEWMLTNWDKLAKEISITIGEPLMSYYSYTTGKFGKGWDGVCLQFEELSFGESRYAIFNVDLQKAKGKGRLANKQFKPGKRSAFMKFWKSNHLPLPRRNVEFNKKLHHLKKQLLVGEASARGKIKNTTLRLASISYEEILEAHGKLVATTGQQEGIGVANSSDNSEWHTKVAVFSGNNFPSPQLNREISNSLTTGHHNHGYSELRTKLTKGGRNYGLSSQVSAIKESHITNTNQDSDTSGERRPQNQSTEQWLEDYDNAT